MRETTGNQNKHVILVLDGFGSHCYSWKSLHKMADAKIKVIKMPSHTSSALQPLDVAVFKVLKGEWRAFVDLYQLAMPGEAMSKYDLYVSGSRSYGRRLWREMSWPDRV